MYRKKKLKLTIIICFIVYELLFTLITAPFYVYKGPFNNLKKVAVGTIMGTRHQYLATKFLSASEIDDITNRSEVIKETSKTNIDKISIAKKKIIILFATIYIQIQEDMMAIY